VIISWKIHGGHQPLLYKPNIPTREGGIRVVQRASPPYRG